MSVASKIITGIILFIIVSVIVVVFFFMNSIINIFDTSYPPAAATPTRPVETSPPLSATPSQPVTNVAPTPSPSPSPSPSSRPATPSPTTTNASPTPTAIAKIDLSIISVDGTGFSRTATGELTNSGNIDLHNSKLKMEIFSGDRLIRNDSQPYIEKLFGTLKAGAVSRDTLPIRLSLVDGLLVQANGCNFVLTFTSNQKNQTFTFTYQP